MGPAERPAHLAQYFPIHVLFLFYSCLAPAVAPGWLTFQDLAIAKAEFYFLGDRRPVHAPLPKLLLFDRVAADRLRQLRWWHDITLEQCARSLEIDVCDFMEKERGRKTFSSEEFTKLAEIFALTPEKLLGFLKAPA